MRRAFLFFGVLMMLAVLTAQVRIPGPGGNSAVAAVGTFALSHTSPTAVGCSGTTTCSIALSSSLAANNLATIQCYFTNAVSVKTANVGGTIVPVASTGSGNTNTLFSSSGYIYPTAATAGPVVVTASADIGAGSTCVLREYTVSAGTPRLDSAHAALKAGTTSVTGETLATLSGTNDLLVQSNNTDYQLTTAVATYGNGKFDATNGPGWADRQNTVSTTAPTWTITSGSGNAATNGMAFATNATACNDEMFLDLDAATNGATFLTTTLSTSTFGYPTTGTNNGWSLGTTPTTGMTSVTGNLSNLHTAVRTCGDGTSHTNSGGLHLHYDLSTTTNTYIQFEYLGASTKSSIGFFYQTSVVSNAGQFDSGGIFMGSGPYVITGHQGSDYIIECGGGGVNKSTVLASMAANTLYWVTVQMDTAVGGSAAVYDTSTWTQVGSNTCAASGWAVSLPSILRIGRTGSDPTRPADTYDMSGFRLNASGTYPLLP